MTIKVEFKTITFVTETIAVEVEKGAAGETFGTANNILAAMPPAFAQSHADKTPAELLDWFLANLKPSPENPTVVGVGWKTDNKAYLILIEP